MWGGLAVPPGYHDNPIDFFMQNTTITIPPMIIFHGMKDITFDYRDEPVDFSHNALYSSESHCLQDASATYSINQDNNVDGYLLGGQRIYNLLDSMGIGAELYLDC